MKHLSKVASDGTGDVYESSKPRTISPKPEDHTSQEPLGASNSQAPSGR